MRRRIATCAQLGVDIRLEFVNGSIHELHAGSVVGLFGWHIFSNVRLYNVLYSTFSSKLTIPS